MFSKVEAFYHACGQIVSDHPLLPSATVRSLRKRLLAEEVAEYASAEANNDIIEVADGLADIVYIACGTAISYGVQDETDLSVVPFSWAPRTAAPTLIGELSTRRYRIESMLKAVREYEIAEEADDLFLIKSALYHIVFTAGAIAYDYAIPLSEVFDEVHRSNMTKLDHSGKPIIREDGKIMKPPHFSPPDIARVFRNCKPSGDHSAS